MAAVTLFQPTDLEVPQLDGFQFNEYYADSETYYAGFGSAGEGGDLLFKGSNFGTKNAVIKTVYVYMDDQPQGIVDGLSWDANTVQGDWWVGRSLGQIGLFSGNDEFLGSYGDDKIYGYTGDDSIVGGDGRDILWGGLGSDLIYGQGGSNTFLWEADNSYDRVVISVDGFTDAIYNLDSFDEIIVQGVSSNDLQFDYVDGGVGVFARGVHEATYLNIGTNFSPADIGNLTRGEFS